MARAGFVGPASAGNADRSHAERDRSHAPRGNANPDAPRPASALKQSDAERLGLHAHAERGNDHLLRCDIRRLPG